MPIVLNEDSVRLSKRTVAKCLGLIVIVTLESYGLPKEDRSFNQSKNCYLMIEKFYQLADAHFPLNCSIHRCAGITSIANFEMVDPNVRKMDRNF